MRGMFPSKVIRRPPATNARTLEEAAWADHVCRVMDSYTNRAPENFCASTPRRCAIADNRRSSHVHRPRHDPAAARWRTHTSEDYR